MKKSQQIIGLPIISISNGNEVGKIKNIIINEEKGAIDYFVVDSGVQVYSTRVIPTENVLGIGEYALTILNADVIQDISKIPTAIDMLQKNITVKGTKVLTKKGSLIGETGDIYVNTDAECTITGIEYIADITLKKIRIIPRNAIITYGKNLTVVEDNVLDFLLDTAGELESDSNGFEKKNSTLQPNLGIEPAVAAIPEAVIDNMHIEFETAQGQNVEPESQRSNTADLFEERQKRYLIGKKAAKTILDATGQVIVHAGEVITESMIDIAKANNKLVELVMNYEA